MKYDTLIDLILISELTRSNYKLDMSTHIPSTSTDNDNEISLLDSKIRYERILVPHDGSEMSDRALRLQYTYQRYPEQKLLSFMLLNLPTIFWEKEKKN